MKSAKTAALVLAALILPLLLAATTYLISAGSFEAPGGAAIRLENAALASPRPDRSPSRSKARQQKSEEDESGPCDEAEHAGDPRCAGGNDDDDNSGSGSDDSGSDDSDNSGPGSDDSGGGSDNSGPGSDNSGSGSSGGDD